MVVNYSLHLQGGKGTPQRHLLLAKLSGLTCLSRRPVGIIPQRRLWLTLMNRSRNWPKRFGSDPYISLCWISKSLMPIGKSTWEKSNLKRLWLRYMVSNAVFSLPNKNEASPVRWFLDRSRRFTMAFPNDLGIGPLNPFCPKNRSITGFWNEPKLAGIEPDSRLARRSSRVIFVR
uniref:Uncharacterized protein n=1 Tax=Opuntia streptacantha TaxID=393608 RepID=A0A7C9ABF7_OPUST